MSVRQAFVAGLARVHRAPALVAGLWLSTIALAWPLALALRGMIAGHLGGSMAAESAVTGVNFEWWNEFLSQTAGVGSTFVPAIIGFAAVLKNVSGVADAQPLPVVIAAAVSAHLVLSTFLLGGTIDRLARDRRTASYGFFAACGMYFFRFLRLAVISGLLYYFLFTTVHHWLFESIYTSLTHDVDVERTAFVYRVLLYLVFAIAVMTVNVVFDYAKIRMVVEDRRSAIGALPAAVRFISRNATSVLALYLLDLLLLIVVMALYAVAAPGAAGGVTAWMAFAIGQLYIVLRLVVRLQFVASQTALFQGRLAHAGYIATPLPAWPDSPAVDAINPR